MQRNFTNFYILAFIIIISIINSFLISANAQWIQQNSGVNAQLYKVKFLNRYTGWTCGAGVILKTTNAGTNWINVPHPATNKSLYGLFILDSNTVYVTGYFETILKTTNSGQSWIEIKNGPVGQGNSYRSVFFINQNTGWIGSNSLKILKTTNAGQNFIEYNTAIYDIYDLYFKDSLNGILINFGLGPYKTNDGGINWYYPSIHFGNIYPWFWNISVISNQYCFIPGSDGRIYKSSDFGENWDSIGRVPIELGTCSGTFANLLTGWVGGNYYNKLFKTTNGGVNWAQENAINFGWFSLFCYNELVVWGVSGPNFIMYTTTGGQPFNSISNNIEQNPKKYELSQNYPNPFNSQTTINYSLINDAFIKLSVYDIKGKKLTTLINKKQKSGAYKLNWNTSNLSSSIYLYSLFINDKLTETRKMILLK